MYECRAKRKRLYWISNLLSTPEMRVNWGTELKETRRLRNEECVWFCLLNVTYVWRRLFVFQRLKKHKKRTLEWKITDNHVSRQKARMITLCAFKSQHAKCYHRTIKYLLYSPDVYHWLFFFYKNWHDCFNCHRRKYGNTGRTGCVEQHERVTTRIMFYKYCSKSVINHLQQSRQLIT